MYQTLINEYEKHVKDVSSYENTIFDICGFPHYENVVSNVLAFYLDNKREHGMGNLFIEALLKCSNIDESKFELNYNVEREVKTQNGNFIDIFIYNNDSAIVIENKIFASLYNDLDEYYNYAKNKKLSVYGIVLSLNKCETNNNYFINVTYKQYIDDIKKGYGNFLNNKKLNYLSLMFDFIKNIENLKEGNRMNKEFIEFLRNNHDQVYKLGENIKNFHDDLRRIVYDVNNKVIELIGNIEVKQWPWRNLPEFYDVAVSDIKFCESRGLKGYLNINQERFILEKKYPIETNSEIISNEIVNLIKILTEQ